MPYDGGWIIFLDFGDSYRILEACDLVCLITGARGGDGVGDGDAHCQQHQRTRRHPQYSSWKWRRKNIRPMDGLLLLTAAGECQEHENDFQFCTNCWMHPDKDSNCAQLRKLLWMLADKKLKSAALKSGLHLHNAHWTRRFCLSQKIFESDTWIRDNHPTVRCTLVLVPPKEHHTCLIFVIFCPPPWTMFQKTVLLANVDFP